MEVSDFSCRDSLASFCWVVLFIISCSTGPQVFTKQYFTRGSYLVPSSG